MNQILNQIKKKYVQPIKLSPNNFDNFNVSNTINQTYYSQSNLNYDPSKVNNLLSQLYTSGQQ